jgi:hypothetical protein
VGLSEPASPTNTTPKTLLVYGATGKAGSLVLERALAQGWAVAAFVRNPDKVLVSLRSKVTLVKGNLCDGAKVSAAVHSSRPNAIIEASSALPIGHAIGRGSGRRCFSTTRATEPSMRGSRGRAQGWPPCCAVSARIQTS